VIVAFDSDVLIYAAIPGHPLGNRVLHLLNDLSVIAIGSVLLRPETLIKPTRQDPLGGETKNLTDILSNITLVPCSEYLSFISLGLGVKYGLKTPDAIHLATAVDSQADRFLTNNQKDFPKTISEINVIYPTDL
jgi:predicted nucleic acid-binding protein